jgi:hypothetical protein
MATSGKDDPTGPVTGLPYFPVLERGRNCEKTSDDTDKYNCIGLALDDDQNWWSHEPDGTWPASVARLPTIAALVSVFESAGYKRCDSGDLEAGFEKVALYVMPNGDWSHAARQRPGGDWSSKFGPCEDIRHDSPELLNGDWYGTVYCIMKRTAKKRKRKGLEKPKNRKKITQKRRNGESKP